MHFELSFTFRLRIISKKFFSSLTGRSMATNRQHKAAPFVVLVVEDHADFRDYLTTCVNDFGCRSIPAANGAEALTILESETVDLIISDLEMPKMDGLALLEELRQRDDQTPFVLLSSRLNIREMTLKANEIQEKPIAYNEVNALIKRYRDR